MHSDSIEEQWQCLLILLLAQYKIDKYMLDNQQFEQLLNKLERLQKERQREDEVHQEHSQERDSSHNIKKNPSGKQVRQFHSNRNNHNNHAPQPLPAASSGYVYPTHISKYEVLTTLGAGTFGRVKQVMAPNKEVLALKQISKSHIINLKQVDHIKLEKRILSQLHHPFIYQLKTAFQDDLFIYMIFEYCSGGELFNRLRKDGRFSNDITMFYTCEILLALCYMHDKNIVYRDLKPENLLIDRDGHVKIADFGFAKKLYNERTFTLCGTPEYLAPEIILGSKEGYGKSCDWWALGVLVYELLTGHPPFYDMKPLGIYQKILKGIIEFPGFLSVRSKDLIRKLLNPQIKFRLGVADVIISTIIPCHQTIANKLQNGQSIREHKWFRGVDWESVYNRKIPAPWVPILRSEADASWFDKIPETPKNMYDEISDEQQKLFRDF